MKMESVGATLVSKGYALLSAKFEQILVVCCQILEIFLQLPILHLGVDGASHQLL
jgi:hypothetical protein